MTDKEREDYLDESNRLLDKIDDINDNNIDKELLEYETFVYNVAYDEISKGMDTDKNVVFHVLDFYLRIENEERINYLINIIGKEFLKLKFKELIENEFYESCTRLKRFI